MWLESLVSYAIQLLCDALGMVIMHRAYGFKVAKTGWFLVGMTELGCCVIP